MYGYPVPPPSINDKSSDESAKKSRRLNAPRPVVIRGNYGRQVALITD